jgi:tetratricopeptide (TPR) repeat protein
VDLSGLGGSGKSQIALEHLHRHHEAYPDGAFWLRGETPDSLRGDFAALAWRLQLEERTQREQEQVVQAVIGWLRAGRQWLLVIDNLDEDAVPTLNRLLARELPGEVLVTSRVSVWDPAPLDLGPMPRKAAIALLLERSGEEDAEAAAGVAEDLGRLPLALVQAAGYVRTSGCSLAGYARLLRTRLAELLKENVPQDYRRSVVATWQLSFDRIQKERPAAAALLRVCAVLAPEDIPLGLLLEGAGEMPEELREAAGDEIALDRAVGELRRYQLVDRRDDDLSVHRLVQTVIRHSMTGDEREHWLGAAVRVLRGAFPADVDDPRAWPLCNRLLPHAQVVLGLIEEQSVEPPATAWLLDRVGNYLRARGEFAPVRPFLERALAIREKVLGPEHPDTATSLNNLAVLLQDQRNLAAARSLLERALAIREKVLGPEHPDTGLSIDNLAWLLQDQLDLATARPLLERALAITEKALGPEHPDIAARLANLALLLATQRDLAAGRPLWERALAITEKALGADQSEHPHTVASLNNLALMLGIQGALAAARSLLERSLAINEKMMGPEHPDTATSLNNLALALQDQGDPRAARPLLERALAIREKVLGHEHPDTAAVRRNLELVLAEIPGRN